MKVYDPKTAITNRLQGRIFTINNENDEKAMLEDMIRAGSDAFAEYISECGTLKREYYIENLEATAKETYNIYLSKSLHALGYVSLEYIKNQIKEQAEQQIS